MDRILVLVRHGQSDWNLKNLFTGWEDPDLTSKGVAEARAAGKSLKAHGLSFVAPSLPISSARGILCSWFSPNSARRIAD